MPKGKKAKLKEASPDKVMEELQLKKLQLKVLLEITKSINRNLKIEELFAIYEDFLKNELLVGKLALFTCEYAHGDAHENLKCSLFYGADERIKDFDVSSLLKDIKVPQSISPSDMFLNEFATILPVFHKDMPLAYVLIGDYRHPEMHYEDDALPFVQLLTNIILVANENKRFAKEQIKQAELKKEMQLAAKMQTMLFPVSFPDHEQIEVFGTYLPHHRIGGDYYDFFLINDNELLICIADVSGKGVSAALLMSNFQANLHALVKHFTTLHVLVTDLNRCVMESANGEKHITFFVGMVNIHTHVFTYVNAGHPPPIMHNSHGVQLLKSGTTGLGMFEPLPFLSIGYTKITPDTTILCYTDGVIEMENDQEDHFGAERLGQFMMEHPRWEKLDDLHHTLVEKLTAFNRSSDFLDDISLLSCRFKML